MLPENIIYNNNGSFSRLTKIYDDSRLNVLIQKRLGDANYFLAMNEFSLKHKDINTIKELILNEVFSQGQETANFIEFSDKLIKQ